MNLNNNVLTCSDTMKQEYCCTVVRIGECFPIEGADRIQRTLVNGMDMIIQKSIQPGDIMIYAANETELDGAFLSTNNLYGINDYELNANFQTVRDLINAGRKDEAKLKCGFFTKQNRVHLLKLKGTYSFGFLFSPTDLMVYCHGVAGLDFEKLVGMDFDTVCGTLFVKAYVPKIKKTQRSGGGRGSAPKRKLFDRLTDNTIFRFHYDSKQLQRNMHMINPTDVVYITPKIHGTSVIFAFIPCRTPLRLPWYQRWWNVVVDALGLEKIRVQDWYEGQGTIYSTRTVVKNRYVDLKDPDYKPKEDVWSTYYNIIKDYIPDNCLIYGEICGSMRDGTGKYVQKDYDYGNLAPDGCLVPYRIVSKGKELDMEEVNQWTNNMHDLIPFLEESLRPLPCLWHGTLADLYPDIPVNDHWHDNVLAALKTEKRFGMEMNEPLCKNKVPREGICIRIDNDAVPQNFKLKCSTFLNRESKSIDAGEVDIEMQQEES